MNVALLGVDEDIDDMLKKIINEPSTSSWGSGIVIVQRE